jgi:hypothetical protein
MIQSNISPDLLEQLIERASATEHFVLRMDTPNKNGRTYPSDVVADALAKFQLPVFGTHMDYMSAGSIQLDKVSHKVLSMRIVGDELFATVVQLNTPHGDVLEQMGEVEYRTAGLCNINSAGIVSDLQFLTVAWVMKGMGS